MNWFKKYFQTHPAIIIEMNDYTIKCKQLCEETIEYFQNKQQELENFTLDDKVLQKLLSDIGYPYIQNILSNLNNTELFQAYQELYKWSRTQKLNSESYDKFFNITRMLRDHMDKLDNYTLDETQVQSSMNKVINLTERYMTLIKNKIENAINNLNNWSTNQLLIKPLVSYYMNKEDYTKPATSASVEFGDDDFSPSFTLFFNGTKLIIDDVLESGDTDFFTSHSIQNDYFSLIKELKNPGSSKKPSKNVTLYTARPSKDRQLYLDKDIIPSNIFLAKDYNTAEGYAIEFRDRDIWKVVIEERYIIQTNDYPKEYQTIGNGNVPIKSITLLSTSTTV